MSVYTDITEEEGQEHPVCDSEECSAECAAEADGVLSPDTMYYVSLDEVLMGTRVLALGVVLSFSVGL